MDIHNLIYGCTKFILWIQLRFEYPQIKLVTSIDGIMDRTRSARSVGQRLTHVATGALPINWSVYSISCCSHKFINRIMNI